MTSLLNQFPERNLDEKEQLNSKDWQIPKSKETSQDQVCNDKAVSGRTVASRHRRLCRKTYTRITRTRRPVVIFILGQTSCEGPPPFIVKVYKRSKIPRNRKSEKRISKTRFHKDWKKPRSYKFWERKLRFGIRDISLGNFYEPVCARNRSGLDHNEHQSLQTHVPHLSSEARSEQLTIEPADCIGFSDVNSDTPNVEELLGELVNDFDDCIVRDYNDQCGFVVIYPERPDVMEDRDGKVPTLSTGTQLGEGILREPAYSVAVEFAKQHGYGFVEFVEDIPSRKRVKYGTRKKLDRKSFSRVLSTREETTSVLKKESKTPRHLARGKKCLTKLDMQREAVLTNLSFLERVERNLTSVGNIADQISDIDIPNYDHLLSKQIVKMQLDPNATDDQPSSESPEKIEEEIIKSAPLDEYMEYLSTMCRNIYQSKGDNSSEQTPEELGLKERSTDDSLEKPSAMIRESTPSNVTQTEVQHGEPISIPEERKWRYKRRDNNNNISEDSNICHDANPCQLRQREELKKIEPECDGICGKLPRLNSKTTKLYRFCNSLSSCIYREQQRIHSMTGTGLGVTSDALKSEMEVVHYSKLPNVEDVDEGKDHQAESHQLPDQSQKTPQISSSSSRATSPSKVSRHAALTDDHPHQPLGGFKAAKHEHGFSSCIDLTSSHKNEAKETGRGRDGLVSQRSPSRESTRRSAPMSVKEQEIVQANSSYCAQGDVKVSPSRKVDRRPREQGDVELSPKDDPNQEGLRQV